MPSRSSGRVVLDGLEALESLDALDFLDLLEFYFLGGGTAVDVDTHEVDTPGHVADVEAVATNGLDGAAVTLGEGKLEIGAPAYRQLKPQERRG